MTEIELTTDHLIVRLTGWDRLLAFKRRLQIPLTHIRDVQPGATIARGPKGIRFPGSHIPGVITVGTFLRKGERSFWSVRNPDRAIVIALDHERYHKLIIDVPNPDETIAAIRTRISLEC